MTPDLTTFCRLDELGLVAIQQHRDAKRAVLKCNVLEPDVLCSGCGTKGAPTDSVVRELAHEPFGHRPATLLVRMRRYQCSACRRVWCHHTLKAAPRRAKISYGGLR